MISYEKFSGSVAGHCESWETWPRLFLVGLGLIVFLIGLTIMGRATAAVLGIIVLLILAMGLRRPAFVAAALILVEFTIARHPAGLPFIGTLLNTRLVMVVLGFAIFGIALLFGYTKSNVDLGPGAPKLILLGVAFVLISGITTAFGETSGQTISVLRFYSLGLGAMILIPLVIKDDRDFKLVAFIIAAIVIISAGAAIMQHVRSIPQPALVGNGLEGSRSLGLSISPIQASIHFMIAATFMAAMITQLGVARPSGQFILIAASVLFVAVIFTFTRSAVLGVFVGVASMVPIVRSHVRRELLFFGAVLSVALILWFQAGDSRFAREKVDDISSTIRAATWRVALQVARERPIFGVGYNALPKVAPDFQNEVLGGGNAPLGIVAQAGIRAIHNDFLRVWVSFGVFALTAFVFFQIFIGVIAIKAYRRTTDPWLRGASLGCVGAIAAYSVHSLAHNLLDSSFFIWIIAGLAIALLKLVSSKTAQNNAA